MLNVAMEAVKADIFLQNLNASKSQYHIKLIDSFQLSERI